MKRLGGQVLLATDRIQADADVGHNICEDWERQEPWPYLPPLALGLSQMEAVPQRHMRLSMYKGRRRPKPRRKTGGVTLLDQLQDPALRTSPPLTPDQQLKIDELLSHIR